MKTSNKIIIVIGIIFVAFPFAMFATTWLGTLKVRQHTKQVCKEMSNRPIRVVELSGEYQDRITISHPGPDTSPNFWSGIWNADIPDKIEISGDTLRLSYSTKPQYNEMMRIWSVEYIIRNGEVKKLELNDWQKQAMANFTVENLRQISANFKPVTDKPQRETWIND